jgi:pimeloyl-ACP methyl ester carboxylesterase
VTDSESTTGDPVPVTLRDPHWGDLVFDVRLAGPEDAEAVVLLHGFPQTSLSWRHQLPALAAAGYRVIAPDQRGYSPGARPEAREAYGMSFLVGDVLALADEFGIGRFHLVGHDWGGAVAWQVAGRHGERLLSLVSLSTPHPAAMAEAYSGEIGGDQLTRSAYVDMFRAEGAENGMLANEMAGLRLVLQASGLTEAESQPYLDAIGNVPTLRAALNWYRAASLADVDEMGPITMPTLYIWSTNDPALGREAAEATGKHVDGPYTFVELEGVDHWVAEHAVDETNRALLDNFARAAG